MIHRIHRIHVIQIYEQIQFNNRNLDTFTTGCDFCILYSVSYKSAKNATGLVEVG